MLLTALGCTHQYYGSAVLGARLLQLAIYTHVQYIDTVSVLAPTLHVGLGLQQWSVEARRSL